MKYMVLLACIPMMICASESPINSENDTDETEKAYHSAIDKLFARAQESLIAKEDIITSDWLKCKEVKDIENLMSDLSLIVCFDVQAKKEITKKLQEHLETEIRNNVQKIFDNDEARTDDLSADSFTNELRQFLYLSKTVCKLSDGPDCDSMMRGIKDDSFPLRQHARMKKKMRQQVNKENMRRLCKIVEIGAQPR